MTIDSTKTLQGSLMPILDFKTEKEDVFTLKNTANLNLLINRNRVINVINKFELSTYGSQVILSGGYIHLEYRYLLDHAFEVYPYAESQWAESRGMNHKISTGLQSRYRLINTNSSLMFAAVGLFFEYEKWQHPALMPILLTTLIVVVSKLIYRSATNFNWVRNGRLSPLLYIRGNPIALTSKKRVLAGLSTSLTTLPLP